MKLKLLNSECCGPSRLGGRQTRCNYNFIFFTSFDSWCLAFDREPFNRRFGAFDKLNTGCWGCYPIGNWHVDLNFFSIISLLLLYFSHSTRPNRPDSARHWPPRWHLSPCSRWIFFSSFHRKVQHTTWIKWENMLDFEAILFHVSASLTSLCRFLLSYIIFIHGCYVAVFCSRVKIATHNMPRCRDG